MRTSCPISLVLCLAVCSGAQADEGMWTFDNVPVKKIKEKYGFEPSPAWLQKLQMATVNLGKGTGAFVSRDGLVITNHHIARADITKVSTGARDYMKNGFIAINREQEIKLVGLSLKFLVRMDNVTDKVNAGVTPGMPEGEAMKVRQEAFSKALKEIEKQTGLNCEQVTLYNGGEYWVYCNKKLTDIRLVAAPELQLAIFGGESDNYTYPRWNLDFALLRAYDNGKPYQPDAYLPFAKEKLRIGDLTFISGLPGITYRQQTHAQMLFAKNTGIPYRLQHLQALQAALNQHAGSSPEAARLTSDDLYYNSNVIKRLTGQMMGLSKPENLAKVEAEENKLKLAVLQDPRLKAEAGQSWAKVEQAVKSQSVLLKEACQVDGRSSTELMAGAKNVLESKLLHRALQLVRLPVEKSKADKDRLEEFTEGKLSGRINELTTPSSTDKALDGARLTFGLQQARRELGANHPFIQDILGKESPETLARQVMEGTRIHDVAFRKALVEGGSAALSECKDPLIVLAKKIDPYSRSVRKKLDEEIVGILREHGARLARAKFTLRGRESYPDANFTFRLSYGAVATYPTASGTFAPPFTTFLGLYDRHAGWGGNGPDNGKGAEPNAWHLPQRWLDNKSKIALETPFNFIYSCDTVGGNSGSPVVNAKGEFVGVNFDGVMEGQGGYYVYDDATKRAVAVDAGGILEALSKILDGEYLVKELKGQ